MARARYTVRPRSLRLTRLSRPIGCSSRLLGAIRPSAEADIETRLTKEIRFDPDLWIIEVEDRTGRNFLDNVVQ